MFSLSILYPNYIYYKYDSINIIHRRIIYHQKMITILLPFDMIIIPIVGTLRIPINANFTIVELNSPKERCFSLQRRMGNKKDLKLKNCRNLLKAVLLKNTLNNIPPIDSHVEGDTKKSKIGWLLRNLGGFL